MAKLSKIVRSFNAGELSRRMDSRSDQQKYDAGAKTMENFIPLIYGAAERRPGTEYIATQKSSSAKGRLVAFEHSVDDTYVLLFENQALRFFKNGAQVTTSIGSEDLSAIGSIVGHWKLNDNIATTAVVDADGATHNGTIANSVNSSTLHKIGKAGTGSFDFDDQYFVEITDSSDFSFIEGVNGDFSICAWAYFRDISENQVIISKWDTTVGGSHDAEWYINKDGNGKLTLWLYDETNDKIVSRQSDAALTTGWHFICATYEGENGSWSGATAANFITLYVDGAVIASTATNDASYVKMVDGNTKIVIGGSYPLGTAGDFWKAGLDSVSVHSKKLSASEISTLHAASTSSTYEIETPYLTADLFELKYEQSADVLFITHPAYEPRRLSRFGDDDWLLEAIGIESGPFRTQNSDVTKTIAASGADLTKGASVTLTAAGHSPFVAGTTAGHLPSGSSTTSKSLTGALFKLVHASNTPSVSGFLVTNDATDNSTAELAVPKGITWDLTTNGTWGTAANSATIQLQREYGNNGVWEAVTTITSAANRNVVTSGKEEVEDAQYRVAVTEAGGDTSEVDIQLSIRDTSHVGIVQITAVTSSTVATGTVLTTLGSTAATHRWSEGSFSNRRGWPIDVTISSEERLTFAGNVSRPLTIWGSVIGDFTDFALGADDDDGIQFTLVGTGQQNRIRWMLAKETLVLGTVGGEHLLGASKDEEALSPTNVKAKIQTTYGSENIAALLVSQAVLFVQRGGKKIREFLYNFEADSHKADDLTVFADHITGAGIVDMAFQRTPDPTLWCIRTDGQIAVLTYERDQNVFSWYRAVTNTNLAGTATASVIESAAVIYGGARSEDEVWVTVLRQIGGADARYVERFRPRLLPSSQSDYRFLDSSITDTGGDTTITGLDHLEGQTVQVLGDGLVQATKVVASNQITAATTAAKYQVGLGYDSTLVPMDLDIEGTGLTTTKRINRAFVNLLETIGGTVGPDSSRQESTGTGTTLFTGPKKIAIPGGYTRDTDITIKQTDPLPMTVLSVGYDVGASND